MANIPADNHFVPQVLSKNFTNSKGLFWYLDSNWFFKREPSERTPKGIFHEKYLYVAPTDAGGLDPSLEYMYQKHETAIDAVFQKIINSIRSRNLPTLNADERFKLDRFFYHQIKRVPDFYEEYFAGKNFEDIRSTAINDLQSKLPNATAMLDHLWQDPLFQKSVKVANLKWEGREVLEHLATLGLGFVYSENPKDDFVLGSNPICLTAQVRGGERRSIFPIASDVLVVYGASPRGQERLLSNYDHFVVRRINRIIAGQSTTIAAKNKSTIDRLKNCMLTKTFSEEHCDNKKLS